MGVTVDAAKDLVAELCRLFYDQGWVGGTGGGISVKASDGRIVMAPSGVQKERMQSDDMYVLDTQGEILETPVEKPPPARAPKLSECSPLFMAAYELRDAGAVIHSHSANAVMATMLDPDCSEFRVTHLEMIKGIQGHGFYDNCVIPVIENTARECELTDRLRQAIEDYPNAQCVLVRRHGVYVWGKDWIQAKTQAECYDYLFGLAIQMRQHGIEASKPPAPSPLPAAANGSETNGVPPPKKRKTRGPLPICAVLDIEGTVAPISFVADVMFPYARKHVRSHLESSYESAETEEDLELIRTQHVRSHLECSYENAETEEDLKLIKTQAAEDGTPIPGAGLGKAARIDATVNYPYLPPSLLNLTPGLPDLFRPAAEDGTPIPDASEGKAAVIDATVTWVEAAISADRKITALKTLQKLTDRLTAHTLGHIWRGGFGREEMKPGLFRDGHIWRGGFGRGEMKAELFRDVPDVIVELRSLGVKSYIYSSGSREAQKQFFGHTQVGDLRPYLSGFFDTTSGPKVEARSYKEIYLNLGCDSPSDILFATDNILEGIAAKEAGWSVVMVERPGNKALPADHGFRVITSMTDFLP
eukprot:gene22241-29310_t